MGATFDERLRRRPAKFRLGKNVPPNRTNNMDLRQKINSSLRPRDARTILRNRITRRPARAFPTRDARSVLQKRSRNFQRTVPKTIPFIIPTKTVNNDLFVSNAANRGRPVGRARPPLRRFPPTLIPDLLSLPTVVPSSTGLIRRATAAGGLFADLTSPSEALLALSAATGGAKLSPIQGFRVKVTNLQPSVTLDDVYELFSSVGSMRLCNLIRPGQAEVVYNEASDAKEAVRRYHGRELDHKPMHVHLLTPVPDRPGAEAVNSVRFASRLGPSVGANLYQSDGPLSKTRTSGPRATNGTAEVDINVIRKALFNVATESGPRRPVDFNVSLR